MKNEKLIKTLSSQKFIFDVKELRAYLQGIADSSENQKYKDYFNGKLKCLDFLVENLENIEFEKHPPTKNDISSVKEEVNKENHVDCDDVVKSVFSGQKTNNITRIEKINKL